MVARTHNKRYPNNERHVDSVWRKFSLLYRRTIPTRELNMHLNVSQAKSTRERIGKGACLGGGESAEKVGDNLIPSLPVFLILKYRK